jgi:hypothetical protein
MILFFLSFVISCSVNELTRASPPALSLERELKKIEGEDVER